MPCRALPQAAPHRAGSVHDRLVPYAPPRSDSQTCQLVITKRVLNPVADTRPVGRDHVEAAWRRSAHAAIGTPEVLRKIVMGGAYQTLALERINARACAAEC